MGKLIANTEHVEHMMIRANVTSEGIEVTFADGCNGLIPFAVLPEVGDSSNVINIELPNLYQVNIHVLNGELIELPWDFVRHYCDVAYRPKIEAIAFQGRRTLGKLIRTMRENAKITQAELARTAGIGRVTEVRIEKGEQSPRYETLVGIAKALKHPIADLVSGVSPAKQELQELDEPGVKSLSGLRGTKKVEEIDGTRGIILKAKAITERSLDSAMKNDWKTSLRLLKEAETIVPDEYYGDIKAEIKMVWLCIQKTTIGPLIAKAQKSVSVWDYQRANELLVDISSILETADFPLDYEDYSLRVVNVASEACRAADRWGNSFGSELHRTLLGVSVVKANTEEIIEKITESERIRF
ncbi:helix-turn-helix domain-containing protein [Chloroflexota bacterium]